MVPIRGEFFMLVGQGVLKGSPDYSLVLGSEFTLGIAAFRVVDVSSLIAY